jgi:hypothetical protein
MNQEIYLKFCPEQEISEHYDVVNCYLASDNSDLFSSAHISEWIKNNYEVFLMPRYNVDLTPVEKRLCFNALQYSTNQLNNMFKVGIDYCIEQIIVCKEYSDQRASKISEKKTSPEEYAYKAYCPDCMKFCCTCDSSAEDKKDEPFYCNVSATSCDGTKSCSRQCTECYNYATDGMISKYSKLGGKILHDKFVHGDYMDYWDVIPVNKASINNLVESPNSYIYIQLRNNPDYWYRITDYSKEELMNMIPVINTIIEIDNKYDRKPPTVSTILEENETRQDLQIKISLTILTVGMASFVTGFVMDHNALIIFGALCIPILLFFSVWYSTQSNKFRKL